jgi:putative membrane protein
MNKPYDNSDGSGIPRSDRTMRTGVIFALFAGLAVSTALIAYHSFAAVGRAVWGIGWGLGLIVGLHFLAVALCGIAWRVLFVHEQPVNTNLLIILRWIRESINTLLPVARIGGDIAGARLLVHRGTSVSMAGAGIVADRTVEVFSQFFFALAGFVLVLMKEGVHHDLTQWAILGIMVVFPMLIAFLLAQRMGLLRIAEKAVLKLVGRWGVTPDSESVGIHDAVWTIYGNGRRLASASFLHTLGWLIGAVQIWIALKFMGHEVGWANAFIIESLSQVVCTAAFIMPAALGAQEAGYMVVGRLLGVPPELGLALSLVKRLSDILTGIPGLLVWQGFEGMHLWVLRTGRQNGSKNSSAT